MLSTRRDLLPPEFISELSRLQDDVSKVPWPDISEVLEASLGGPVTEKFASFDTEPIAAASIPATTSVNKVASLRLTTGQYAIQVQSSSPSTTFFVLTQEVITGFNIA